ncbi:MAG: winged helix-turn-helix transcriptional regulator [Candidatus Caldarchaeum sp.]|nr:winged helix-turn-helix transcriptional regulator [Candidatus Caldarchaeum sp.]
MKPEDLDMGIINLLKTDARISIKDMAQSLGVSPATVSKRIKKLENLGYIKGYVTILDDSKIGFGCRLMLLIRTSGSADVRKLGEKLADMDESCIALLSAGSYDLVDVLNCRT